MLLTQSERADLYLIAWMGEEMPESWHAEIASKPLLTKGLVSKTAHGLVATHLGLDALSPDARKALQRPKTYSTMSERQRWAVDSNLGLLDWDGT